MRLGFEAFHAVFSDSHSPNGPKSSEIRTAGAPNSIRADYSSAECSTLSVILLVALTAAVSVTLQSIFLPKGLCLELQTLNPK